MPARGFVKIFPCCLCPAVRFLCVLTALFPWTTLLHAQASYADARSSNDFQSTIQHAALIFDGTVTSVQCEFGKDKLPQTYRISFQVKQGVRGAATGSAYTIREWAGLWAASRTPRYRIGERALLFFYSPSSAGLTSTVGGRNGKLSVLANAAHEPQISLPPEWLQSVGHPSTLALKNTGNTALANPPPSPIAQVRVTWLLQRIAQIQASPAGGK